MIYCTMLAEPSLSLSRILMAAFGLSRKHVHVHRVEESTHRLSMADLAAWHVQLMAH